MLTQRMTTLLLIVRRVTAFDRDICLQSTLQSLNNKTLTPDSPYFYRDKPDSPPYIDASNLTLTLAGCNALCGSDQAWYPDIGPRLNTWLVPVILLLANVEVSPLGKRNFLEFLHMLGDPIDSLWSLSHKIDAWDRCYDHAARYRAFCPSCQYIIATVFAGYEEIQGPRVTSEQNDLDSLISRYSVINRFEDWRRTAKYLAEGRTDELLRTLLALVLYVYQLVSKFVPAVGGPPSSVAGTRIATSALLSCFIPSILLTNIIGGFASRRSAYMIMNDLTAKTDGHTLQIAQQKSVFLPGLSSLAHVSTSNFDEALAWSGGVYMFRPWKSRYVTSGHNSSLCTLLYGMLAATPVIIGFVAGSLILWWQTPRGFNCRHIWLIGVSLLWIVSSIITLVSYNFKFVTGKYHWRFVLIKDACITVPGFLMFFLSASGLFNSCWCWSGPWEYPGLGRIILPAHTFLSDGKVMYPMTSFAALVLQLFIVAIILFSWRRGLRLLRWSEEIRQEESVRMSSDVMLCGCISSIRRKSSRGLKSEEFLLKSDEIPHRYA